MNRKVLANGLIKLSSKKGIVEKKSKAVYSEVICSIDHEKKFVEVEDKSEEQVGK